MPILNYTTEIRAEKSIGEIQKMLTAHGADTIVIQYADGSPGALFFVVPTPYGKIPFRLPANIEAVKRVMERQRVRKKVPSDMASRVAWRILKDWVKAQMAILETEMVDLQEIFLPYMVSQNRTLYETMKDYQFQLPQGEERGTAEYAGKEEKC